MSDMLVKLYELDNDWNFIKQLKDIGICIRKPMGSEKDYIIDEIRNNFNGAWASEAEVAQSNHPMSCFVSIKDKQFLGFACYDATALGFFGPIGVKEQYRGQDIGTALLKASLLDMKNKGYGYAIIGHTGILKYYEKTVAAVEIPDSSLGLWKTWLRKD